MASPAALLLLLVAVGGTFLYLYLNLVTPRAARAWDPRRWPHILRREFRPELRWGLLLAALLVVHLLNVTFLDPWMRERVLTTGFTPVEWILAVEGDAVRSLRALHGPVQDFVFSWYYLVLHHALVLGVPLYLLASRETLLGHRLVASLVAIYVLALPGYLLFPADNPHIHFGDPLVLESAIPGVQDIYYGGTSIDNTFPSLHNGFATLLALHAWESRNPRLKWSLIAYAPVLAFSTVYLQVHWFVDIAAGAAIGVGAWLIGKAMVGRWDRPRIDDAGG